MEDDAIDTVASVLAQAFTLHDKSLRDATAAFKKTLVDDRETSLVVFPLDVMVAKQEVHVILPPLPPEEASSPPPSPPSDPVVTPPSHEEPVVDTPSDEDHVRACRAKARAEALWVLNYRTRPCENPEFLACGECAYGRKCRFFHHCNQRRRPPTAAAIDLLADQYYVTMMSKKD